MLALGLLGMIRAAHAADQEGCLFCHRLELANAGATVSDLRVAEITRRSEQYRTLRLVFVMKLNRVKSSSARES